MRTITGRSDYRLGEQQRLAFARVLLTQPDLLFLDEATSALDEASEARFYQMLRDAAWHPTIVSVGHRGTLARVPRPAARHRRLPRRALAC